MNRIAGLAALIAAALTMPAYADVVLDPHLSGTGDNVIFESLIGGVAKATFNGQHQGFADFTDLSGNPLFTGAANGNDIKISNTSNLNIQVFNNDGSQLGTTTQVFSLKGTGDVHAALFAVDQFGNVEAAQNFDLGVIDPNAQSGFTFTAINGEVMTALVLLDIGGQINDYEHYRIDAAVVPTASNVPIPGAAWLFGSGMIGLLALNRRRKTGLGMIYLLLYLGIFAATLAGGILFIATLYWLAEDEWRLDMRHQQRPK